ncbi:TIGR01620 family protein [Rhodoblastus acidophilus]|uniref:TIGR01620 family protein n=1 Tax=Candidatus Rhodoblastus alkanivorans TaxID=2954117 RepID=A0ABS9Z843_9HYPH|nr:TIGR01620 family protein [Candidatus Rhodoblastus alkanivorans]MCI4677897.1 TIGR01620 family protein [Candidatus Rhodoblastus alkanivorans]MCI4683793.1 TIGR01620 family protein [Candidatus Rhodoblastus alkanivorans]MDI4641111.1 TIGR01620 family protein [Rhodoblastus acidophilus]
MTDAPKSRPRAFRLDELAPGETRDFVLEERPDAYEAEAALLIGDPGERATEEAQARGFLRGASFGWGGLLLSSIGGLIAFAFGLWLDQLVESLFTRSAALGFIGLGLAGLALLALAALVGREARAIFRQRKVALLHKALALAHETDDREMARAKVGELAALYDGRPALAAARAHLADLRGEIVDGRDLIDIAERRLMPSLDAAARQEIAGAAKRVSLVSAISPRATIDMIFVAGQALRLIRRISEIYGGRPGMLGAWRLARAVGSHLAITGGMAFTDGLAQQIIGHGLAARISARLGEGVVNGTLTARIGLSAISVCRPMPFFAEKSPSLRDVAPFLFSDPAKDEGVKR